MKTEDEKKQYLISLVKLYYPQGDDFYASKNKKDKWHFGYSNDYPMQHGSGQNFILPDRMVEILIEADELNYWRKRCKLAERYIEESPCDPDIYPEQYKAYVKWQHCKNKKP